MFKLLASYRAKNINLRMISIIITKKLYRLFIKHLLDTMIAFILLLLASPLLILAMLLLAITQNGAVFFTQRRPGYQTRPIEIIKLKTMTDARDENGDLLPDHERLTALGRLIRSTSIDELPQLMNVLKGDMSLIGPRPLLFKYLPLYSSEQLKRHEVKPGITGWAQVNGRNTISWSRKFELDVYYVEHLSFAMDLKIFFLTIKKILIREGINQTHTQPMAPFNGHN